MIKYKDFLYQTFKSDIASVVLKNGISIRDRIDLERVMKKIDSEFEISVRLVLELQSKLQSNQITQEIFNEEISKLGEVESSLERCIKASIFEKIELTGLEFKALSPFLIDDLKNGNTETNAQ